MLKLPDEIAPLLPEKNIENIFFRKHLRNVGSGVVDAKIQELSVRVSSEIDCTACANCCKKLEPGLEDKEILVLAAANNQSVDDFREQHVAFDGDALFLRTKPCMFLKACLCTVYESRPAACSGYPHLEGKDIKYRKSFWENYTVCPIVFNVIEGLKQELGFVYGK